MPRHAFWLSLSCFPVSPDRATSGLEQTPLAEARPAVPHPSACRGWRSEQRDPTLSPHLLAGEEGTWRK